MDDVPDAGIRAGTLASLPWEDVDYKQCTKTPACSSRVKTWLSPSKLDLAKEVRKGSKASDEHLEVE